EYAAIVASGNAVSPNAEVPGKSAGNRVHFVDGMRTRRPRPGKCTRDHGIRSAAAGWRTPRRWRERERPGCNRGVPGPVFKPGASPPVTDLPVHVGPVEAEGRLRAVGQPGASAGAGHAQVRIGVQYVVATEGEGPAVEPVVEGEVQRPLGAIGLVAAGIGGAAIGGEVAPARGGRIDRELAQRPDAVEEELVAGGALGDATLFDPADAVEDHTVFLRHCFLRSGRGRDPFDGRLVAVVAPCGSPVAPCARPV